jgi:hypothetical protein
MKTMTFNEFSNNSSFNLKESAGAKCMSEAMHEKLNEMYEAMCEEMGTIHNNESEMTAENYKAECSEKLNEMLEGLGAKCNEYMK